MANWKIRDIAPPKKGKQEKKEERSSGPQVARPRKKKKAKFMFRLALLILVLAIVGVGVIHIFFAKAEVAVWPKTRTISLQERVRAAAGAESLNIEERIIPTRTLTGEKQASRLFEASSKTVKENRAEGTIRVFNANSTNPMTLIANTRFISEDGKLFRTPSRLTIPGAEQEGGALKPGFIDIRVVAAEPGEDYNIGPSNFSLPGLAGSALYTTIYAESTEVMSGGSEREVAVVSAKDIDEAKKSLEAELKAALSSELLSQVPDEFMASADSVVVSLVEASTPVEAGAEVDRFNVSLELEGTAFLFPRDDVEELMGEFLAATLEEGERVQEDKTNISFTDVALDPEQDQVSLTMALEALAFTHIDSTELKIRLRGKSEQAAGLVLSQDTRIEKHSLSLWPFWISSVPGNVDRLKIQTILD